MKKWIWILVLLGGMEDTPGKTSQKPAGDQQKNRDNEEKAAPVQIPGSVEFIADIEFGDGGGKPLLMNVARARRPGSEPLPAVLWAHGGGWKAGSKDGHTDKLIHLATNGFVSASIDYRLSGEAPFPAAIEDCKCAVRFLRANAAKYGINPARIGAWGGSAGDHLVELLGVTTEEDKLEGSGGWSGGSSRVQAVCSWYGPADLANLNGEKEWDKVKENSEGIVRFLGGKLSEKPELYKQASPISHVSPDDPPFLLMHGDQDTTVPVWQSEVMAKALKSKGVPVELIVVTNAGHIFRKVESGEASLSHEQRMQIALDFFRRTLKR